MHAHYPATAVSHEIEGFSLVELSIVLVILGLLTGGILAGQSLIRASELRAVATEYQAYQTAIMSFRERYMALPGDMRNATQFWGQATNCGAYGESLSGGTCNGNGNGIIGWGQGDVIYALQESFYAWHHLQLAGMVAGNFSGNSGAGHVYEDAVAGLNVPSSKMGGGSGWCFNRTYYGSTWMFNIDYTNALAFGNTIEAAGGVEKGSCQQSPFPLSGREAWQIDAKIDDGMPARGKVIASQITRCTDAWTAVDNLDAKYTLSGVWEDEKHCGFFFRTQ